MSEKIELDLYESTTLTFGVDIHGASVIKVSARLIIDTLHSGMNIAITGVYEHGKATFDIPTLSNILSPGTHNASLELILENERFFSPLKMEIMFIGHVVEAAIISDVIIDRYEPIIQQNQPIPTTYKQDIKGAKKNEDDLIMENIELLSKCRNTQSICFEYSKRVLLRAGYIPLNVSEVIGKLDLVCQQNFNKTFAEFSAKHR